MGRILLVDDHLGICCAIQDYIDIETQNVHNFEKCQNGEQALFALQNHDEDPFHLMITDYQLKQGLDGVDLAMIAVRRGIAHIFINTGYDFLNPVLPKTSRLQQAAALPGVQVVRKMDIRDIRNKILPILAKLNGRK